MTQLLVLREHLIQIYQKHAQFIRPVLRFLMSLFVYAAINEIIGYNPILRPWYVVFGLSLAGLLLPAQVLLFLASVYAVAHIYYVSVVLALVTAIVLAILYFIYIRFVPQHGYIILAVPILYALRVPFVLPILLGRIYRPVAIIPMSCGIVLYQLIQTMTVVIGTNTDDSLSMYNQVLQQTFSDKELYFNIGIFALITIVVYLVRNMKFSYCFEVSVLAGMLASIVLVLGANFFLEGQVDVGYLVLEVVVSAVIAWLLQVFILLLNYSGAEYLQFEDDEYYYYVKAVPKINVAAPMKRIKRFNPHPFETKQEQENE